MNRFNRFYFCFFSVSDKEEYLLPEPIAGRITADAAIRKIIPCPGTVNPILFKNSFVPCFQQCFDDREINNIIYFK